MREGNPPVCRQAVRLYRYPPEINGEDETYMVYTRGSRPQASERSWLANSPSSTKLVSPRLSVRDCRVIMSALYSIRHGREVFITSREAEELDRILIAVQECLD